MTETRAPGIPTEYRGVEFRSQLEARVAILFDLLKIEWVYEPIELEGYIPDFLVQTTLYSRPRIAGPLLVEVRPALRREDFNDPIAKIARSGWTGPALVVGAAPFPSKTVWGVETTLGYAYPVVAQAHADDSSTWYAAGWISRRRQFGMGGDDLTAAWREATNRSKWMPPR